MFHDWIPKRSVALKELFCSAFILIVSYSYMSYNVIQIGGAYRHNMLSAQVVPHFDSHALSDRPIVTDDNTRPHTARSVGGN